MTKPLIEKQSDIVNVLPIMYGFFLGNVGFALLPFWLGTLVRGWGVSNTEIGAVITLQLLSAAVASLSFAAITKLISRQQLIVIGTVLQVSANLASGTLVYSASAEALGLLAGCRVLAGVGDGLVLATMNAVIASSKGPQKLFTWSFLAVAVFSAITFAIVPTITGHFEQQGLSGALPLFFSIACYAIIGLLVFCKKQLPQAPPLSGPSHSHRSPVNFWKLLPLIAVLMLFAGISEIYSYIERIASTGGVAPSDVGKIKAIGSLVILIGPAIAGILGNKLGHFKPMLIGILILACANIAMSYGAATVTKPAYYWLYATTLILHDMSGFFLMIYTMSYIALLDKSGKLAATVPAFQTFGGALGPVIGGVISDIYGYWALGWGAAVFYLFYIVLLSASAIKPVAKYRPVTE